MTRAEWLAQCLGGADKLKALLREYHPVNRQPGTRRATARDPGDYITAPSAEHACVDVRANIRQNFEGNPCALFDEALLDGDVSKLMKLLNEAWFGVPESTSCWRIDGFAEAVSLIADLPEDEEETHG